MAKSRITVALAGNPNSGKTTLFNALTGLRQHVGNYPGVTVEKKEGFLTHGGYALHIVDLPGTYSLTAHSLEEIVARNYIMESRPDVVVDVIDSSNLERHLYLAVQMLECGVPLVLAFNMSDVARERGYDINIEALSGLLGVPIVRTIANKNRGIAELLDAILEVGRDPAGAVAAQRRCDYGAEIEPHLQELTDLISRKCRCREHQRWFALKLLEDDEETRKRLGQICGEGLSEILHQADRLRQHIERIYGDSAEVILADRRYGFISGACAETVRRSAETRRIGSDRIDTFLTNRYLGLPIFALLMFLVFQLTFSLGNPLVEYLNAGKNHLADLVRALPGQSPAWDLVRSLLADGVIEGVGAVLQFVPLIALLYLAISILEDTGYMARGAFVTDRLMHRIGLHGKSFIPMLVGFGCTVPAVMSTRILESRRDRLLTMLVLPLISCGAKLPVYVLILGAFFPQRVVLRLFGLVEITNQALWLLGIYGAGILLMIVYIRLLRATAFRGEGTSFVMELPPYRMPTLKGLVIHVWERVWMYLKKAGTIILAMVIVLWALKTWPRLDRQTVEEFQARRAAVTADSGLSEEKKQQMLKRIALAQHKAELQYSAVGRIGRRLAPLLRPCGFDWRISTALLGSLAAKEVFISQMGIVYAVGGKETDTTLSEKLAADYSPLQGISIMLFILIASPCLGTVAVTFRESGTWKWALLQWAGLTAGAWLVTTLVYQTGLLLGLGGPPA